MRKVNLRNVDPAIDDPDASTWCWCYFFSRVFDSNFFLKPTPPLTGILRQRLSQILNGASLRVYPSPENATCKTRRLSPRHALLSAWVPFL